MVILAELFRRLDRAIFAATSSSVGRYPSGLLGLLLLLLLLLLCVVGSLRVGLGRLSGLHGQLRLNHGHVFSVDVVHGQSVGERV